MSNLIFAVLGSVIILGLSAPITSASSDTASDTPSNKSTPTATPSSKKSPVAYEAHYIAEYKGGWIPIEVNATRALSKLDSGEWQSKFKASSSLVDMTESTLMQANLDTQSFIPNKYIFKTTGLISEERVQIFHWDKLKVWGEHKKQFWKYELLSGSQDSMSYQEQLRWDLINNKQTFAYPVTYKHKLKEYEFELVGTDTLKTPNGNIETIKVKQKITKHNKLETHIWFAVNYDYVMVKLRQKRDGKGGQEIRLKKANVRGKLLKAYK